MKGHLLLSGRTGDQTGQTTRLGSQPAGCPTSFASFAVMVETGSDCASLASQLPAQSLAQNTGWQMCGEQTSDRPLMRNPPCLLEGAVEVAVLHLHFLGTRESP